MIELVTEKKSNGKKLSLEDCYLVVDSLLKNKLSNNNLKFFLALASFGMEKEEVLNMALAIRDSGRVLSFNQCILEKHSTGGVADSSSVALIPLVASLGFKVIKMSGKSLVYTNGSADRFGAIANFNVLLSDDEIKRSIEKTNACVLSHNGDICPADRIIFDIIEKCGLESDINILAMSIAAKKLASGPKMVLVDVKFGRETIIKTYKQAKRLAHLLRYIFKQCKVESTIVITNANQTISSSIGNGIEVVEALEVLRGKKCPLREVVSTFALEMVSKVEPILSNPQILDNINDSLDNGKAYKTFLDIVRVQGGDVKAVENGSLFRPVHFKNFVATKDGYVGNISSQMLGELVRRMCKLTHDPNVGVRLYVRIGDYVHAGDKILTFYYKNEQDFERYKEAIAGSVRLTHLNIKKIKVIKKVLR